MSWVCVCACSVSGLGHGFHLQITPITPAARDKSLWFPGKIGRESVRAFSANYISMQLKHRMVSQGSVPEGRFVLFYCNSKRAKTLLFSAVAFRDGMNYTSLAIFVIYEQNKTGTNNKNIQLSYLHGIHTTPLSLRCVCAKLLRENGLSGSRLEI